MEQPIEPEKYHVNVSESSLEKGIVADQKALENTELGTVKRGLKSRHIQFIAIGGTIGTGLFVGSGGALVKAGPLSMLIGYTLVGAILWTVLQCVGEMATYLPIPGGLTVYATRYVGGFWGVATGFNYWFGAAITLCAEISAAALVVQYWTTSVNVAVWITIVLVSVLLLNIISVKGYGEAEFIFASIKVVTIVILLITSFIIDLGGGPTGHRLGFQFWKNPGAMQPYLKEGSTGRFLGVLSTFVYAAFAYGGGESIAVAACEAVNPRRNIPKAVKRVFWRVLIFYFGGVLSIGLIVSSRDPKLMAAIQAGRPGAGRSPFVIGIQNAGIKVLPHILNAVILSSAWSSGNAYLYAGSRNLYALALARQAPRVFARCNRNGVPWVAVLATWIIGLLSYLNCNNSSSVAFGWFSNMTSVTCLFNWFSLSIAYIRFRKGCITQGITDIPFRAKGAPFTAYWAAGSSGFIILVQGFEVFFGDFSIKNFAAAYVGLLIFFVPMFAWMALKGSDLVSYKEMDLLTGKAEVDAEERDCVRAEPRNWVERVWFAIA